jgi:hypothetical protein
MAAYAQSLGKREPSGHSLNEYRGVCYFSRKKIKRVQKYIKSTQLGKIWLYLVSLECICIKGIDDARRI